MATISFRGRRNGEGLFAIGLSSVINVGLSLRTMMEVDTSTLFNSGSVTISEILLHLSQAYVGLELNRLT